MPSLNSVAYTKQDREVKCSNLGLCYDMILKAAITAAMSDVLQ